MTEEQKRRKTYQGWKAVCTKAKRYKGMVYPSKRSNLASMKYDAEWGCNQSVDDRSEMVEKQMALESIRG